MTRIRLEYYDQNDGFAPCLPRTGIVAGRFASSGGEEWHLIRLEEPIVYPVPIGKLFGTGRIETSHLLLRSRWVRHDIGEDEKTSVFILLVEPSQLPLTSPLRIDEYRHVAWGMCHTIGNTA